MIDPGQLVNKLPTRDSFSWITRVLCACQIPIVLYTLYVAFCYSPVNTDAGYYLLVADDLYRGMVPFKEITTLYMPFAMYVMAILRHALEFPPKYELYLGITLFFQIMSALLLYFILGNISSRKPLRVLTCLVMILLCLIYEGEYIVLEPFVLFFSLSALLLCLRFTQSKRRAWTLMAASGFLASFAFLCKQYGIAVLIPLTYLIVFSPLSKKERLQGFLIFVASFLLPVSLLLGYLILFEGVTFKMIVFSLSAPHMSFSQSELFRVFFFLKNHMFLLLLLPILLFRRNIRNDKRLHLPLIALASFAPMFIVRQSPHYFIMLIPFCLMIEVYIVEQFLDNTQFRPGFGTIVSAALCASFITIAFGALGHFNEVVAQRGRSTQEYACNQLHGIVDKGSKVIMLADPAWFFACELRPPNNLLEILLANFSIENAISLVKNAQIVIIDPKDPYYFSPEVDRFRKSNRDVFETLKESGHTLRSPTQPLEVWIKPAGASI